jgi:predicted  nucleic acid-binding Zn-ribbon protein
MAHLAARRSQGGATGVADLEPAWVGEEYAMNGYEVLRRQIRSLTHALGEAIQDAKDHYAEVKRLRNELTAMTLERDLLKRRVRGR